VIWEEELARRFVEAVERYVSVATNLLMIVPTKQTQEPEMKDVTTCNHMNPFCSHKKEPECEHKHHWKCVDCGCEAFFGDKEDCSYCSEKPAKKDNLAEPRLSSGNELLDIMKWTLEDRGTIDIEVLEKKVTRGSRCCWNWQRECIEKCCICEKVKEASDGK